MYSLITYTPKERHFAAEQAIAQYVSALSLTEKLKQAVISQGFMDANPAYYMDYPYLFAPVFGIEKELPLLSVAGFLYYKSIILLDQALDEAKLFQQHFAVINICQEECIKILSSLYPIGHQAFWGLWYKRKYEYLQAYQTDMKTHDIQSMEDYERLADQKSAIGKVAIDCLYVLAGTAKEKEYSDLLLSHRYFYTAFQIMDDIADFRHDITTGQFNIAYWMLSRRMAILAQPFKTMSIDEKAKYLYLEGVADDLLEKAIDYLAKAQKIAKNYHLDYWEIEITKMHNSAVSQKLNIHAYIKSLAMKLQLSQTKNNFGKSVEKHIQQALDFIAEMQNDDGSWEEIYNNAGLSDSWATAFISSFLCGIPERSSHCDLAKAIFFVQQHQCDKQWGYNQAWIGDNDSSTFTLIAQTLQAVECKDAFNVWLTKQNEDGGFSTYPDTNALLSSLGKNSSDNVSGWTQSHTCVSAAALYLMALCKYEKEPFCLLLNFILRQQNGSTWDAYWWTNSIYSLYFIIKAGKLSQNKDLIKARETAITTLISQQNKDGSFGLLDEAVFYTGLAVDALSGWSTPEHVTAIEKAVSWLCGQQYEDGSWPASHPMRIPAANVTNPGSISTWSIASKGINIRAEEFGRLFSTVVALKSLVNYAACSRK